MVGRSPCAVRHRYPFRRAPTEGLALVAAHRKPRQRTLPGTAARFSATLALAGAATATAFEGAGHAEPAPTPDEVRARADRLYQEAEAETEKYNGAKEKAETARREAEELRDEAARRTERLNTSRNALGSFATAQYRAGGLDPALRFVLDSDPARYLAGAELTERVGDRQAAALAAVRRQMRELEQVRAEAGERLAELEEQRARVAHHRTVVRKKLAAAETLLARLTAEQRAAYAGSDDTRTGRADRGTLRTAPAVAAPNPRAAQAVAYAYGALGKPYVWGATGPSAFDCSGLTQAAWRSAGVALPRTTYTQINAGQRVPRSRLAPGDLVFFYSGVSHVGLYIGGGNMIHAPRPGAPVRIAPIDQMPYAGATRVA
ncbi:Cell wall-associated hydrolase, NlpC family [Streptomyces wuyuanensis]|uniref:Cell wall-associated hydrolase, NlpC family n=1 Tax=Streptomyces wuyuanensis TaxID=1196353 RepID=A0A1G9VCE5_9ACTN|nr:Cell wall-associated hydrolase, NlpC family [Streptomyces wuyuanensis]